jgi:hypothetical protein
MSTLAPKSVLKSQFRKNNSPIAAYMSVGAQTPRFAGDISTLVTF